MSNRTSAQKNARKLQVIAEDELGARPKLTACHDILRTSAPYNGDRTREEWLVSVFLANRERLAESARLRSAESRSNDKA